MPVTEQNVLALIVARRQFQQQVDGKQIIQIIVCASRFGFAIRHCNHITGHFYQGLSKVIPRPSASLETTIQPEANSRGWMATAFVLAVSANRRKLRAGCG
jgi:hypothetical protein